MFKILLISEFSDDFDSGCHSSAPKEDKEKKELSKEEQEFDEEWENNFQQVRLDLLKEKGALIKKRENGVLFFWFLFICAWLVFIGVLIMRPTF